MRADIFLAEKGYFKSRSKAKEAITEGAVLVGGKKVKPSDEISENENIEIITVKETFVSKGGEKLAKAFKEFSLDVNGKICADIGASTGGFTDCLLRRGAKKVYAADVGENQLDQSLLKDSRVIAMDNTNARNLSSKDFPEEIDFICADLSFISLKHVIGAFADILKENKLLAVLIKPQFEAGRGNVGKGGIVRDRALHDKIIISIKEYAENYGFKFLNITPTDAGKDKNTEYIALFVKNQQ